MSHEPIRYAVTIFSGYLQSLGSPGSGMVGIEHDAFVRACNRPDVRVRLFPWNIDANDVAESLWRYRPQDNGVNPKQEHIVVGYSYGGDRAVKFAKALKDRGDCTINEMWLCDAVRRFDCAPGVAGATGLGRLVVPDNVKQCNYFVQRNPRWAFRNDPFQPRGHKVVAADPNKTIINGPILKTSTHSYMDNSNEFRRGVLSAVDRLLLKSNDSIGVPPPESRH